MDRPSIRIINYTTKTIVDEIDIYTSLQFERLWQGVGEFEFHIPNVNPKLQRGRLIALTPEATINNQLHNIGIIRSIDIKSGTDGKYTIVKGQHINGLTSQRIVLPYDDIYNGGYYAVPKLSAANPTATPEAAETILKKFFSAQCVGAKGDARGFSSIISPNGTGCAADLKRGKRTVWRSRYEELHTVLQSISEYCDIGWEIYCTTSYSMMFDVICGVNRTTSQSINNRTILSVDYESINDINYLRDNAGYKNIAYAGGIGDNEKRTVIAVTTSKAIPKDIERYETFVDCGTLTVTETAEDLSLKEEGKHKLKEYKQVESLTATLSQTGSFIYGKNYELGDLVTVVFKEAGVMQDMRITGTKLIYEPKSQAVEATLGVAPASIGRVIRSLTPTIR